MPTVAEGMSGAIIPVSETTTTSQERRPDSLTQQRLEVGAPHLFLALDQDFQIDRQIAGELQQPPGGLDLVEDLTLVVDGPRARHSPSTKTGSKGGEDHSSNGSTGCTSWCPYTTTVGAAGACVEPVPVDCGGPLGLQDRHVFNPARSINETQNSAELLMSSGVLRIRRDRRDSEPVHELMRMRSRSAEANSLSAGAGMPEP